MTLDGCFENFGKAKQLNTLTKLSILAYMPTDTAQSISPLK